MHNEKAIYIEKRNVHNYPSKTTSYNPTIAYPEYPWGNEVSAGSNDVYDMIRNCLYKAGMDQNNYGKPDWNPLGDIINPGDIVLIKPNMVLHENHIKENGTDCLITHPSLVRAVADYVVIALKGEGEIIIGDAPLQSCNFEMLVEQQGYNDIISFYKSRGIKISLKDFRLYKSCEIDGILKTNYNEEHDKSNFTAVNLGSYSMFDNIELQRFSKLRVTNYDPRKMREHHNDKRNEYLIPNEILSANVVINMPKPKTHRKAGVTSALKNLIGINGHKDWLPHHTQGSVDEGGDEYLKRSKIKHMITLLQEWIDILSIKRKFVFVRFIKFIQIGLKVLNALVRADSYSEGSWYGNDTIWRTIVDLNRILLYADKNGNINDKPKRKLFIIGDMIISGDKEGPLKPSPRNAGIIAVGFNAVMFDMVISTLMGFDFRKIPSIINAKLARVYPLIEQDEIPIIHSNNEIWDGKQVNEIDKNSVLRYIPTNGWLDHIELQGGQNSGD